MAIELTRVDEFVVLTLNRPEALNALSFSLIGDLGRALDEAAASGGRALLMTGAGTKAFCAGADVNELKGRSLTEQKRGVEVGQATFAKLERLPMPSVAIINGFAFGGGLELALATDFRIADETAVLGFPEIGLGILPSSGGTSRAARLLGPAQAKRLILLGERVGAREALAAGLVTEVVAEGGALARALELARALAELPAAAVAVAKQAIDAAADSPHAAAILIERLAYGLLAQTTAAREAAEDFGS